MKKHFGGKSLCLLLTAALLMFSGCGEGAGQDRENFYGDNREPGYGGAANIPADAMLENDGGRGSEDVPPGNARENLTANAGGGNADSGKPGEGADPVSAITDFGMRLLQQSIEASEPDFPPDASMPEHVYRKLERGENILLSPLSVLTALAMAGEGAGGETLAQMEEAFGISQPELVGYLSAYIGELPAGEKYKLSMADSIWITEDARFTVRPDFLDVNEKLFDAGIYRASFDGSTVKEINGWVEEHTDGMIEEILEEIPADAVMYLVNALAFDAEWQEIYEERQVREGEFTTQDGTVQRADMMYSEESLYLEDEDTTGFLKYYADEKYAFVALLPGAETKISEYAASLTGQKLRNLLNNAVQTPVDVCIPKYEGEYAVELSEILRNMGMEDAFSDVKADFSGIGFSEGGNLFISQVLHKTFIAVDERGTKAGAATTVEISDRAAAIGMPDGKTVHLDRPFVYLILDCGTGIPVFIGALMSVQRSSKAAAELRSA